MTPRARRISSIAGRHLRRTERSRLIGWTLLLALVGLLAQGLPSDMRPGFAILLFYSLLSLLLTGAGGLGEDIASGGHMLDRLHGATPAEIALGSAAATVTAASPVLLLVSLWLFRGLATHTPAIFGAALAWTLVTLAAWSGWLVALGALAPGKGNSVILAPLFLFGGFPPTDLPVDGLPRVVASLLRGIWSLLPLQAHTMSMIDSLIVQSITPLLSALVLLLSGPALLALATLRLGRLQAAAGWAR
ncbi:MAG: hypothetical protein M3068_04765 [Gemmatimonadota bacterium]|nr:hypothetical protein [Gemmatimonadota bacterium]